MVPVEFKDFISGFAIVASSAIAVWGWSKSATKDRNQHLFQKRLERRVAMLDDMVAAMTPLLNHSAPFSADPSLREKLAKARSSVQLYGYADEVNAYEALIAAAEEGCIEKTRAALLELASLVRMKIREEMGYGQPSL
jgi:hypothetical protein